MVIMPDELDRYAARRVVIVTEEPTMDDTGRWMTSVDCDDSISPNMAKGILLGGIDFIDTMSERAQSEEE